MTCRASACSIAEMAILPPHRAFVVKISVDADPAHVAGHVEHVESGTSAQFEELEELGAFLARVLAREQSEAAPEQGNVE